MNVGAAAFIFLFKRFSFFLNLFFAMLSILMQRISTIFLTVRVIVIIMTIIKYRMLGGLRYEDIDNHVITDMPSPISDRKRKLNIFIYR